MSTFIFSLNDISVSDASQVVSVNNSDSFFGLIKGSQLFIAGKLPVTIEDHDTTARTITLRENWSQGDLSNVAATVVPIGAVSTLLQALENNRAAYQAFLDNAGGGGSGNGGEISWSVIIDPPITATSWPTWTQVQGDINEVLPETATRFPTFPEIGGKVLVEQLPDDIDTDNKRTRALSPPIKREKSFNQILSDYPTLKKTEVRPTESPNNKRMIRFDDVRGEVHIALTDRWFTIPTTIASRSFPIFYRGLILRFNNNSSAYTGNIKMRVYPMGNGGLGLPNNPALANHQWHEYETTVTDLYKIGEFNSEYFEGIIEYIELDNGWHQFDVNQSDVGSLNAKFDTAFGTFRSPFRTFYQKADGYWYSEDMFPENVNSIGASWTQDSNNPRKFTADDASGATDALRLFSDSFDDFQFEVIVDVEYISHVMAVTVSNSDPNRIYLPGPARFITEDRIYFKRGGTTTNATLTIESVKMRLPHYG